jgi:hypothetical protein
LRIDADGGSDDDAFLRDDAVARNLLGESRRQVSIDWDVQLLLIKEARFLALALVRIEHDPRFDLRPAKTVGDRLGAAIDQEVAKAFVLAPEIERGIFVLDRAKAAALAQQKRLEVELRDGVEQIAAPLCGG